VGFSLRVLGGPAGAPPRQIVEAERGLSDAGPSAQAG
jgi:hypothetical protein